MVELMGELCKNGPRIRASASDATDTAAAYGEIDEKGWCTVAGDWQRTLEAVAVPMSAPLHGLRLAFSVTVPSYSAEAKKLDTDIGPRLLEMVRRV